MLQKIEENVKKGLKREDKWKTEITRPKKFKKGQNNGIKLVWGVHIGIWREMRYFKSLRPVPATKMRANVAGPAWQRAGAIMKAGATTNFLDLGPSALWTWCGSGSFVTFQWSFFASLSITSVALPWSSNHALNLFCLITTSTCQKRCSLIMIRFEQGWGSGKWMRIHIHKISYNPAEQAIDNK